MLPFLGCSGLGGSNQNNGGGNKGDSVYVAPDPPAEVNKYNLFFVEFFTRCDSGTLFQDKREMDSVASHIGSSEKTTPLLYFLDRSDACAGSAAPHLEIACSVKKPSHFCQNGLSDDAFEGTGIISNLGFGSCEGLVAGEGKFVSGCTLEVPLYTTTEITFLTCRVDDLDMVRILVEKDSTLLQSNGIVIGCIKDGLAEETADYLKRNFRDFRLTFCNGGMEYRVFILSPVWYVCRETDRKNLSSLTYYNIEIEKLDKLR